MVDLPRLGLASACTGPEPSLAGLALLAGLNARGVRVQHFRSRACLTSTEVVRQLTGLPVKHLDPWLMPPDVARAVFYRGARDADLAVVEGTLDRGHPPLDPAYYHRPGSLGPLADALDLPIVAVLACPEGENFHLPSLPDGVEAVLVDGISDPHDYPRLKHLIGLLTRRPVLGGLEKLPGIREAVRAALPSQRISEEVVAPLAASFLRFADLDALNALARARPLSIPPCIGHLFATRPRVRVAYALDEAFGGYFPDTLETLEALGAELVDFSPLRDESLPEGIDIVMIGCGFPDRFADTLGSNQCLISALKAHVCQGRRIYSEGGGTAYLGRSMILPGRCVNGAGILPFDAVLRSDPTPPVPVERTLDFDGWLGPRGTLVRGYRSERWNLVPAEIDSHCRNCYGPLTEDWDFTYHHHAVGSLIHLHLGALPDVVAAFLGPHRPSLNLPRR